MVIVVVIALLTGGAGVAFALAGRSGADSTASSRSSEKHSDSELVRLFGDAVWRVEVEGCGVEAGGTAFAIGPHHLVTNAHVVGIDPEPTLRSRNGDAIEGRVVGMSREPDIAVIAVGTTLSPVLEWADPAELSQGDHILGLGYPAPGDFAATPGSIVSFRTQGDARHAIRTDAALDQGNSGGPALDERGRVVGVVTQMDEESGAFQWVPLVFTTEAVGDSIETFRRSEQTVEPDCFWAGVIEGPPDWDDAPDWDSELPGPTPSIDRPGAAAPASCPSGAPSATVTAVDAIQVDPEFLPEWWDITLRGTVTNDTSAPVVVFAIEIPVSGDTAKTALAFPEEVTIEPGRTVPFETLYSIESQVRPTVGHPVPDWDWSDWQLAGCSAG